MIGIDTNTWLVYEGASNYGHGVWPTPMLSVATMIASDSDWGRIPTSSMLDSAKLIFREDSFDAVTRVRRGRLYQWREGTLHETWHFPPHPIEPHDRNTMSIDGLLHRMLCTYRPVRGLASERGDLGRRLVVLGTKGAPTVWRIISIETVVSGEELVTLHPRSTFGVLPELVESDMPDIARPEVLQALERVADAAFRSSAVSLIDLCRAAGTTVLAYWLHTTGDTPANIFHLDVAELLLLIEKRHPKSDDNAALKAAVRLIQRFHSRGKPNEQKRYNTRPPTEADGQLVLQSLGFILREIGWAR